MLVTILFLSKNYLYSQNYNYPWLRGEQSQDKYYINNIPVPPGFKRVTYSSDSFQSWLQNLPLKKKAKKVKLFDGRNKSNQNAHYRIIEIDIGEKDLQQCADAVIRLYAEYLFSQKKYSLIAFNFTNGHRCTYNLWMEGYRPLRENKIIEWQKLEEGSNTYDSFREYLDVVFTYAGSYSLSRELIAVNDMSNIDIGDVFIQGGFPGHAVIVVDMAENQITQKKIFMIAQSFMPAQNIYILKNLRNEKISPWYELKGTEKLYTPERIFKWSDLKRFP